MNSWKATLTFQRRPCWAGLGCALAAVMFVGVNSALAAPIKAAVARSQGTVFLGMTIWGDLNNGWDQFGDVPVTIDYSSLAHRDWTLDDLHAVSADVVILSNPGYFSYTPSEIAALIAYVQEGHGLIISYGKFRSADSALAPLVGLDEATQAGTNYWSSGFSFDVLVQDHPLFTQMDHPYVPGPRVLASPVPYGSDWRLGNGLAVGRAKFTTPSGFIGNGIIVANEGPGYRGVYFSHYPEDKSGGTNLEDMQLFYNALVWTGSVPEPATLVLALMGGASALLNRRRVSR